MKQNLIRKIAVTTFLAWCAMWPYTQMAQTDLWKTLTDGGVDAYTNGDFAGAAKLLEQALAEAEAFGPVGPENSRVAISLENLAALYDDAGAHNKSVPLYLKSIAAWEAVLGKRDVKFATKLNLVADYFERHGRYNEATDLFVRSLKIAEGFLGLDHSIVAGQLSKLAGVYRKAGQFAPADKLYLRAIAIREQTAGHNSPRLIRILQGYAKLLRATARDEEAERIDARIASILN